jgi:hypothetical protein
VINKQSSNVGQGNQMKKRVLEIINDDYDEEKNRASSNDIP